MDAVVFGGPSLEQTIQGKSMTRIKIWKDDDGYAFEFSDSRIELSHDGIGELICQLQDIESEPVNDGETYYKELVVDIEDDE